MFNEWYLVKDSFTEWICAYPSALTGIRKYNGCCFYRPTHSPVPGGLGGENAHEWGLGLSARACKRIFGHAPKRGELLCVTKTQKGWKSEKIDLEFSD